MTAAPAARPARILVVDDEPFIVQLVFDMLTEEGYEVDTAANGALALEQIDRKSYDLVLSDLRMPEMDGLSLYREVERRRPELARRMIFVSGTTEQPEYRNFIEQAGVTILAKPFNLDDLRRITRDRLASP